MVHTRTIVSASAALVLAATMVGCTPDAERRGDPAPGPTSTAPETIGDGFETATFLAVVDGDTIETSAGTVRIIGIDTPERGECGDDDASLAIGRLLSPGDPVTLELPPGENDRDTYDRLIRYVTTASGTDVGLMQLQAGNAVARYDSSDGYPAHPRENAYHAAQTATLGPDGSVVTAACGRTATKTSTPVEGSWWEQYSSCAKLKKNAVGDPTGPFSRDIPDEAGIYDWFAHRTGNNGDGDGDGLACE